MSFSVSRHVCDADEYHEARDRLPQFRRRSVPRLPPGHLGLLVQAVAAGDCPLFTLFGSVPASADPGSALDELERQLRRTLGEGG